jgi:hypothetical protein
LTELPPNLPPGLQILDCSDNQLTYLPNLPPGLQLLDCFNNTQLTNLPDLPPTLQYLFCDKPLRTLYGLQYGDAMDTIREKVNRWNAENMQQDYVLK